MQADAPFRDQIEDLIPACGPQQPGGMVPIGSLASIQRGERSAGADALQHVSGRVDQRHVDARASAPGRSSTCCSGWPARELPQNMSFEWTDMSYLEVIAGDTAMIIFGFAVVMVFLVLAAQYESWSLPLAVILVVPMCLLSAIIGVNIAGMDINIFTRIGFVVLVGLASKNAILIVEFAKLQRRRANRGATPRSRRAGCGCGRS